MKKIIPFVFFLLSVFLSNKTAYAAENDIKMTVYLSGNTVNKVELTIDFFNDEEPYCMFMIPCKITDNNVIFNSDKFFFDYVTYDNYTLCALAPIEDTKTCAIQITNTFGEIYQGITLRGTITNGECEMRLVIPTAIEGINSEKYLCKYTKYSIIQESPFSSLSYLENGKKVLTEEVPNTEIVLDEVGEKSVTYEYIMKNIRAEEEPQGDLFFTVILLPLLMSIFTIFFGEGENEGKIRMRNKILYGVIVISVIPVITFSFLSKLPTWMCWVTIGLYLFCIILIIANHFTRIKELLVSVVRRCRKYIKKLWGNEK